MDESSELDNYKRVKLNFFLKPMGSKEEIKAVNSAAAKWVFSPTACTSTMEKEPINYQPIEGRKVTIYQRLKHTHTRK